MTKSIQQMKGTFPASEDKLEIVSPTPPAATGPKSTPPAKLLSALATRTALSTLSSISNIETETKKKKKKKKGKAAHREEGEKEKTMKMECFQLLLLLSGVFATASATLIWTLDTSSSPATSSSVYNLTSTSTSTPTFLTMTTNVDVSSAEIYVPVGGFLSHGVFYYSSTERLLEASLGLDLCMLTDDVEVASNMNLTEDPSNLPDLEFDLDPKPAPEPPAKNNELTKISTFEDETETGTEAEHPANCTEKTSWARCIMLTDDVEVASNMNLTEVSSNLPDLDPEPAPEPPATNNELTKISTFEDETETGTGTKHPANSTEKTSWARCMLTDDVQDGSHLNLTEVTPNFPDSTSLALRELETTAASGNEHSEANALFALWNLLCLSIVLTKPA
ncbi:hypothetical protein ScalyP_jg10057 [Parmales sp. scaly parma]|nr:hypothetical protein ScalyP_jg10057 [Parmales sp. scaly parma]